jgi:hypothetical protein
MNPRFIWFEHSSGVKVQIEPQSLKTATMLCNMSGKEMEEIPVVCEFQDLFPEELTELPPDQDIDFVIELMPGAGPVAKSPYRMLSEELDELKKQLKEFLEQGFVRLSASPWGSPVLFVRLSASPWGSPEDVHRLPHAQLDDDQKLIPST